MSQKMHAQDLLELGATLGRESKENTYLVAATLKAMLRIARRLSTLDERACNEEMPDDYDDKLEENLQRRCNDLGQGFGFKRNRDPRGCSVFLTVPSGRTTDIGNRGIGLY